MTSAPQIDPVEPTTRAAASARVARLYEKHGRMTYGICRAMLRDTHDAEDAAQQTFLLAHRALLGGAHVRNEAAWLATIARNECRTRIAASMRSPLPISEEDLAAIPVAGDEAERSAQLEAIRSALADLPERQREAVVLRDLYGLRYGEVATALGLSRPATEALLFRARRAMRLRLKPIVASTLVVPIAVQEGLAQAIPGFAIAGAGSGGIAAGVAGGGLLAKLTAGPVGVKVATATVAVTTVGAVASVESERAGRDRAERAGIVAVDDSSSGEPRDADVSGSDTRGGHSGPGSDDRDDNGEDDGRSGHGGTGDGDSAEDSSGPGSGREEDDDGRDDDRGGPAGGEDPNDDDGSGSGSGSSGDSERSGSGGGSGSDDDEGRSSSGPSGSSSRSSGSSSGPSGSSPKDETTDDGSSGRGSGSSGSSGSGSGSSGSNDSGSSDGGSSGSGSSGGDPVEPDEPDEPDDLDD